VLEAVVEEDLKFARITRLLLETILLLLEMAAQAVIIS
jgi:hypothetical protein